MVKGRVAIIGSGRIGQQWAVLFASANYETVMYDISEELLIVARQRCREKLEKLQAEGLQRSNCSVDTIMKCIRVTHNLHEAITDVDYVQECVFEDRALKVELFKRIDKELVDTDERTIIASSTSAILPSVLFADLKHQAQCLVAHPIMPPIYVPLVELVPTLTTRDDILERAKNILADIGQTPIRLRKELPGFAVGNMQYAVFTRAWQLVEKEDVDKVVSDGFGLRYAFFGPIANLHMNANGIAHHQQQYGPGVIEVCESANLPVPPLMEPNCVANVAAEMEKQIPVSQLAAWRLYRERCLAELTKLKRDLAKHAPK